MMPGSGACGSGPWPRSPALPGRALVGGVASGFLVGYAPDLSGCERWATGPG